MTYHNEDIAACTNDKCKQKGTCQLEKEHSISYSEEMEWLDNLKYRE